MKILELKRSVIRIIAEFHGILTRFPNQACRQIRVDMVSNPLCKDMG
jgi:hypothetical protein